MQFMNGLNMLSDSHLEIPKIPFAKNPFSTPLSQLLSLSSCSSILLSRFFSLQRILPTATRFPLFHPAQAISLPSQLSLFFTWCPSPDHFFSSFTSCGCSQKRNLSRFPSLKKTPQNAHLLFKKTSPPKTSL